MADRQAWLEERKSYIGASEVASILGCNPHESAHELWLVKTGRKEKETTFPMLRGSHMESLIADWFTRTTGIEAKPSKLYRHPKWPFIACNPDYEIEVNGVKGLLECKDVGYWPGKQWGRDGADQVPEHYLTQVAYQLIAAQEFDFNCLYACIDGREFCSYYYSFKPEAYATAHILSMDLARNITMKVVRWWERHIEKDIEPEMSYHEDDHRYAQGCRKSYTDSKLCYPTEDINDEIKKLKDRKAALDRANREHEESKNRIKLYMAQENADSMETEYGYFNYKVNARGVATFTTPFKSDKA